MSLKPHTFFFRQALNAAKSRRRAVQIGVAITWDYEYLVQWCKDQGLEPPAPRYLMSNEVKAQGITRRKR